MNKKGFTLAEVLITLAVIGVVAVLSIGIFMPKIQDKVLATQAKTAKIKFTKAMEQMALNNKIGPFYQDTEEFVAELGNYLKLAKTCDNDKLADCFGYEEIDIGDGEVLSMEKLADAEIFEPDMDIVGDSTKFEGNTVGLVTIDGTPMVLAWNKKCEMLEPGVYQWSGNTNVSTKCVAVVMDVNNTKRPNKTGKDVLLLNAKGLVTKCTMTFTVNGTVYNWSCPFEPTPVTKSECNSLKSSHGINACTYNADSWAGTVKQCGGTDKMPTPADLATLATYLFDRESNPIGETVYGQNLAMNTSKLSSLNSMLNDEYNTNGGFRLWSGTERNSMPGVYSSNRSFKTSTSYPDFNNIRYGTENLGVCKL